MPVYWEVKTVFADPAVSMTKRFTVTKFSVNEPVPESAFDVAFAPGSTVFDDAFSHHIAAVVQSDGSYQPHPDTDPALLKAFREEKRTERTKRWSIGLAVTGALLLAFGIGYRLRRLRNTRRLTNALSTASN